MLIAVVILTVSIKGGGHSRRPAGVEGHVRDGNRCGGYGAVDKNSGPGTLGEDGRCPESAFGFKDYPCVCVWLEGPWLL